ncbi:MAG: transketolase [Candidatus Lightella neohaematopini]|nr:transketolase [Candidatus Lightella neohaematopini]MCV2528687.1 transketolase [Candidatus Lightella neohaematopini]
MISRRILANAIRILSIDAIQNANSGHPGAPLGMADIAEVLWRDYISHNPLNPFWFNRDRFVLSNGHSSILLYAILHLTGYDISINDLKNFRQLYSNTPGHPERGIGVEVTTGPLGQGFANAVGLAIAEKILSARFNKLNYNIIDHYTYVFVGDGCMMEGISHEVASLAGVMKLGKLIVLYDSNNISIDGNIKNWFIDNTALRFRSYHWHVLDNVDGHNSKEISKAINIARTIINKPSLIICKTIIAFGSPNKSGQSISHGSPLGNKENTAVRKSLDWHDVSLFKISEKIYSLWNARNIGRQRELNWNTKLADYAKHYPSLAKELIRCIKNSLPNNWINIINNLTKKLLKNYYDSSTRQISQKILNYISIYLPELIGGSADLSVSNCILGNRSKSINNNAHGNYINYGVREFGMTAIANGISCHGGLLPYTATFLVFSDYARNAIRMAALMKIRHIMIYTHDSIGVGEDGPTHQPIEQLSSLRIIPNLIVWRPCNYMETLFSWKFAIEYNGPTILVLSKQILKQKYNILKTNLFNITKGGYIVRDCIKLPELIIIATGSEVMLAIEAYYLLSKENYNIRVVSLPSTNVFDLQDNDYKNHILPNSVTKRIAIEAGISDFWYKYVGASGIIIGVNKFGKSAKKEDLFNLFKLNVNNIINQAKKLL